MSKLVKAVKAAAGAVGTAATAYHIAVKVEGTPVRDRLAPGSIKIFGVPVFERDANLDRVWFGVLNRGKSRLAKRAIAAREGGGQVE